MNSDDFANQGTDDNDPVPQANSPRRKVVVVLGMHRSGTSLTTNMLQSMGVTLGDELIPGRKENPLGFFENSQFVAEIKSLEDVLGRRPFRPSGLLPFPPDWLSRDEVVAGRKTLTGLLAESLKRTETGVFGFKDPRTCRFLPLWQQVFEELGVEPLYLLALRHPRATAKSNIARTSLTPQEADLIWMLHYSEAIIHTGAQISVVAEYERWFSDPETQASEVASALGLGDGYDPNRFKEEAGKFVTADYDHSDNGPDVEIGPVVSELYERMRRIGKDDEAASDCLSLARQFHRFIDLVSPWTVACEEQDTLLSLLADAYRASGRARERELQYKAQLNEIDGRFADAAGKHAQPMTTPLGVESPAMAMLRADLVRNNRRSTLLKRDNELLMEHCRRMEEMQRQVVLDDRPDGGVHDMKRIRSERARKMRNTIGRTRYARKD